MKQLTILLLLFLTSCSYDPQGINENKDVSPPDISAVNVEINLATNNDTIYIYGSTSLTFSAGANTPFLTIGKSEITDDNELGIYHQNQQTLTLSPYYSTMVDKVYRLTIQLYFSPNSNSIAGQMGAEIFEGTHVFYVKYLNLNALKLNVGTRITPDSILECFWDFESLPSQLKDKVTHFYVDGKTYLPNQKSAQIPDYFGDSDRNIEVTAYFFENNSVSGSTQVQHYEPQVTIEPHGADSVKISWTKIYKSYTKIEVYNSSKEIVPLTSATSAIVPLPFFGSFETQARLYTRSYTSEWWSSYSAPFDLRSPHKIQANMGRISYSAFTNQAYCYDYQNGITTYQLPKWDIKTNRQVTDIYDIYVCQHCSTIALLANDKISVYPTGKLTDEPVVIPLRQPIMDFQVVNDRTIAYRITNYEKTIFVLYDIVTQSFLKDIEIPYTYLTTISPDGQFILLYFDAKFEVYEIKDQVNLVLSQDHNREYVSFHPTEKNVLVIEKNNQVRLQNLVDNTQQNYAIGARFLVNIDPLSGNFLLTDNVKLHVYKTSNRKIVYSIPYNNSSSISLLGNSLISNGQGVEVMDISKELTK